jgi:flagellar hook-length control protein FliK
MSALQALQDASQNSAATAGQPAGGKPGNRSADPADAAQNNAAAPGNKPAAQNFNPTQSASTDSSDSKPAHASQSTASQLQQDAAQPATPQPGAHVAMDAMPQTATAFSVGGSNGANGLTLPVHVTSHDGDAQSTSSPTMTPNTDALAVSIAARSMSGAKQFDIRLDPPELGRVEVRLSIDASGKTQAHMTADQPQTLELLQKDAPSLTRALRDAGLDVSQSGLNFSLKGQGQNQGQNQGGNSGTPSRSLSLPAMTQGIEATQSAGTLSSSLGNARLDIHV